LHGWAKGKPEYLVDVRRTRGGVQARLAVSYFPEVSRDLASPASFELRRDLVSKLECIDVAHYSLLVVCLVYQTRRVATTLTFRARDRLMMSARRVIALEEE
jgi:hypothetical protein